MLRNVIPGTYTLIASGIGYTAIKRDVVIIAGKSISLNLELDLSSGQLKEVSVTLRKNRPYDEASAYAAKLHLRNIEKPQAINTVTNQRRKKKGLLN